MPVRQDERDEPAGVLLERIKQERARIGEKRKTAPQKQRQ